MLNIDSGSGSGTQGPNTGSTEMVGQIYRNLQGPRPRRTDSGSSADAPNSLGAGLSGGSGRQNVEDDLRNSIRHDDYMRQLPRWWRPGDVYAPHDLSSSEMGKWRKSTARRKDVIDLLGLRPLDMYRVSFFFLFGRGGGHIYPLVHLLRFYNAPIITRLPYQPTVIGRGGKEESCWSYIRGFLGFGFGRERKTFKIRLLTTNPPFSARISPSFPNSRPPTAA